jgi:hypothetical protein
VTGLKGDVSKLKRLSKTLQQLPTTLGAEVAKKVAPDLTGRAQASFRAGESVYGDPRPTRKDGSEMTLVKSGRLLSNIRFVSVGTRVRAALNVRYAKYYIRFGILPRGGAKVPTAWAESINRTAAAAIRGEIGGAK